MSKIKDCFSNIAKNYKHNVLQYTFTHIIVMITTAILVLGNYDKFDNILEQIAIIGLISAINAFASESFCKKTWQRVITGIIGTVIGIIFARLIYVRDSVIVTRIIVGYCATVFLIGLMKVIKNSKLEFHEYCTQIFQNLFNSVIIYLILNIGLSIIISIFILLLLDNVDSLDIILRLQIAIAGWFLVPAFLMAITNSKYNVSKFIEVIISFVLLPLTILATIIIYLYMAKMFIMREIPANSIFRILAGLFVVAFPVWTMAYSFREKNKIIKIFCKAMPISFIPFIGLQIYSISVRCKENGITPLRYLGIMLIIFEVVTIFLSLYKNRKYILHTITTGSILLVISTILPVVNMHTISNMSQANRLLKAWKEEEKYSQLTEEQKEIVLSSYYYLINQEDGKKYIPEYLEEETIKDKEKYYNINTTKNITYTMPEDGVIYIAGYSYIEPINTFCYKGNELKKLELNKACTIDITEYILDIIKENEKSSDDAQKYIIENRVLKVNDTRDLYIKDLSITYTERENITEDNINYVRINGYVLIK